MSQQEPTKPRELRLDLSENQGWAFLRDEHWKGPVLHVIEKSHADALEQKVQELTYQMDRDLVNYINRIFEKDKENASLTRKLAKAVEQRNEHFREALCGLSKQEQSEYIDRMDAELNGDK